MRTNLTQGDDKNDPPPYRTQLLCRTYTGDVGVRPLPSSFVYWHSPDIWVVGPDGQPRPGTDAYDKPTPVRVRVKNVGQAACYAAHVDLYWGDHNFPQNPSLTLVGSVITTLMAGEQKVLDFSWLPPGVVGVYHLIAHVYEPSRDALVSAIDPRIDRHVGVLGP